MAACAACGDPHPDGAGACPVTGDPVTRGPCGTQIDRYAVERLLGGGGMGAVYRGRHVLLGQPVAIKLLRTRVADNPEIVSRFQREAQAAAAIGNAHIVRVSDFGETAQGQPFLVMELLEGADLEHVIARRGPLPIEQAVDVALQLLDGLGAAHGAGIVHRDLKPGNVLLTHAPGAPTGPRDFVKIVDFGISKVTTESGHSLTKTGVVLGTPYYMAPEQARATRDQDHRVDLYAAAVIVYQMLARALPFDGASYEELVIRICTEPPRALETVAPHVPKAIRDVVERGMAKDPRDRWPTAAAFADALRAAAGRGVVSPGLAPSFRTPPPHETLSPTPMPDAWPAAPPPLAPSSPASSKSAPASAASAFPPAASASAAAPAAAFPPGGSASAAAPAPSPPPAPPARRSALLPAAIAFLAIAILSAAGVAVWLATRTPDTAPIASLGPTAPVAPGPGVPLVPIAPVPALPTPAPPPAPEDDDDDDWMDLSDLPSGEEIARIQEQAMASVPVPPAPEPTRGVSIGEPYVMGDFAASEIQRALAGARAAFERCRRPGAVARVRAQAMLAGAANVMPMVSASGPDPTQNACVANTVRDALRSVGGTMLGGIVYVEVALPPP